MSLTADGVSVFRGGRYLCCGVSATFSSGSVTAIVGPNGAGKTTFLRTLSGELNSDEGQVYLDDQPMSQISLPQRALLRAVMTQSNKIAFDFSVEEVLLMGWVRSSNELLHQQYSVVVDECRLEKLLSKPFNLLSGGEQQRVQFARALLQLCPLDVQKTPRYLLLDEPTASLDVGIELAVFESIRRIAQLNIGVIVVLHDLNLAARFADKVCLLDRGELVAFGDPCEVIESTLLSQVYATHMQVERHERLDRLVVHT